MRQLRHIVLLFTVAIALVACNRNTLYSHYEAVNIEGWEKGDKVSFLLPPPAEDSVSDDFFEEVVCLRTSDVVPFQSIILLVEQDYQTYGHLRTDTLHAHVIDSEGRSLGQGVAYKQYEFPLDTLRLRTDDTLRVTISHMMRRESLPGITDVGFTVLRCSSQRRYAGK